MKLAVDKVAPIVRLHQVDWARGLAALWVVLHHVDIAIQKEKYFSLDSVSPIFAVGYRGVDLFFLLSGFVMAYSFLVSDSYKKTSAGTFIGRRLFRIFPVYLAVMLSLTAVAFATGIGAPESSPIDLKLFVQNLLLLPRQDLTTYIPVVAWTLSHELLFYLIFALFFISRFVAWGALLVWSLSCLTIWALGISTNIPSAVISPLNLYFPLGIFCCYVAMTAGNRWKEVALFIAVILCAAAIFFESEATGDVPVFVNIIYAAAFFLFVIALTRQFGKIPKFVEYTLGHLGKISYSLYLVHYPIIIIIAMILTKLGVGASAFALLLALSVIASIFVSTCTYYIIEKPFIIMGKKYLSKHNAQSNGLK